MSRKRNYDWGIYFAIEGEMINNIPYAPFMGGGVFSDASYHSEGKNRTDNIVIFQYTLSGSCIFCYDGTEYEVPAGSGFLCFANDPKMSYRYNQNDSNNYRHIYTAIIGNDEFFCNLISTYGPIYQMGQNNKWFQRVNASWKNNKNNEWIKINFEENVSMTSDLITDILGAGRVGSMNLTKKSKIISDAKRILNDNQGHHFSVANLAKTLRITPQHLTRKCKEEVHLTAIQLIDLIKIDQAKLMLKFGKMSIKEIAYEIGFSSYNSFLRTFKRVTKISPVQFKEQL